MKRPRKKIGPPKIETPAKTAISAGANKQRRAACKNDYTVTNSGATRFRRYVVDAFLRVEVFV